MTKLKKDLFLIYQVEFMQIGENIDTVYRLV